MSIRAITHRTAVVFALAAAAAAAQGPPATQDPRDMGEVARWLADAYPTATICRVLDLPLSEPLPRIC